jgi:hypothetical protein
MISLRPHSISLLTLAALAAGCSSESTGRSSTEGPPGAETTSPTSSVEPGDIGKVRQSAPPLTQTWDEWRTAMSKTPLPKDGCFQASHPNTTWEEVPCTVAPKTPHLPARDLGTARELGVETVGGTSTGDFSADVSGTISWAQGSFPIVSGLTNAGNYSLQLNTNTFDASGALCKGASNCSYWEQFVYDSPSSTLYIEYWIINATTCPSSAWQYVAPTNTTGGGCVLNSPATGVPGQPITNLFNLAVTGQAGSSDAVTMWAGNGRLYSVSQSSVLGLNQGWKTAEFNVFGDGNGDQVNFNAGTWIVVQTLTNSVTPTTAAPACISSSTTAETNNLNLVSNSCCAVGGVAPGIWFTESNISGATAEACPDTTSLVSGGSLAASQQFGLPDNTDLFTVDNGGALTVTWAAPGAWTEPVRISNPQSFRAGAPIAASQQFGLTQTDVFGVDLSGNLDVMWTSNGWAGPAHIGTSKFIQGTHLATSQQFGLTQTDVFAVDASGALTVTWVGGGGSWNSAEITAQGLFPPGAPLAASQQFGLTQTDVFLVDNSGHLDVVWVDGGGAWHGPAWAGSGGQFPVGAYVAASNQFGLADNTDVFAVDVNGNLDVAWVNGGNAWDGPAALTAGGPFPAGAPVAASQQFGVDATGQTDVFVVTARGFLDVMWVEGGNSWKGPSAIGGQLPGGAQLAVSQQFGLPPQTDVFAINGSGNRTVAWVEQANPWNGPSQIP